MNEIITKLLASTAAIALAAFGPAAFAQSPQGATIASGAITVTRQGSTTVVTQGTDKGIIDWRSFSIGAQEAVRFDQPGRSSITLNRVTGTDLSRIDGNLSATGQVWLSNPNGVLIGPTGQVNVGSLLATTGRIDATEFLRSGRARIDQIGKDAAIVNSGTINITEGGYAALAAASIRNEGVIAARAGSVALGAGKAVTVDFTGDKLITFQVTEALDQAVPGDSMISVGGKIAAEGGTVLMSARAAKGVMDNVINLKGVVVANSVKVDGGTVSFGDGGIVQVSGKIDASNPAGKGGEVAVLGEKVGLVDGAAIDASGATGGGTVLVGGDWQGKGSVQNAQVAYVAPTASINVDATMAGDGGKAVVWADDTTRFNGTISARGGAQAGNGGQVETSGKRTLSVGAGATANTSSRAAGAKAGSWLLDPNDITIYGGSANALSGTPPNLSYAPGGASSIGTTEISAGLLNSDVTIQTSTGGDIIFAPGAVITFATANTMQTLTLLADQNIDFQANSKIIATSGSLNVVLNSGANGAAGAIAGGIQLTQSTIITNGGYIKMVGGSAGGTLARGNGSGSTFTSGVDLQNAILNTSKNGSEAPAATGNITIWGEGSPNFTGAGGYGVNITNYSVSGSTVTASGAIEILGYGSSSALSGSQGIRIGNGTSATATSVKAVGADGITLTGRRGAGNNAQNIDILGGVITTTSGDITFDGAYTGAASPGSYRHGIYVDAASSTPATVSTTGGSILFTGYADPSSAGTSYNIGVAIYYATISAGGSGNVTITGKRGGGPSSQNIYVQGASSSSLTTLSALGGSITLDGSATTTASSTSYANIDGVFTQNALIQSGTDISITGVAASVATGLANGVSIFDYSTISLTGASGKLSILGNAQSASGNDIYFLSSTVAGGTGTVTLTGNAIDGLSPSWTSGKTVILPRTATNIAVDGATSVGTLGLSGALGFLTGPLEIGSTTIGNATSLITYSGTTLSRDLTLLSNSSKINFTGASLNSSGGAHALTLVTDGVVSFAGSIGGTSPLSDLSRGAVTAGKVGITQFGAGVAQITTNGTQSYSGPVELAASSVTFNTSLSSTNVGVTFNGAVDSASSSSLSHTDLTVNASSSGGVLFKDNFGLTNNKALKSFTAGSSTAVTLSGDKYITDGAQAYGGKILLGNDATISVTSGAVTFSSTIDTAPATGAKGLTVYAGSVAFNTTSNAGTIGGGGLLSSLSLSVSGSNIALPALTANALSISISGTGGITQSGGASVTNLATIDINTGTALLFNPANDFNQVNATVQFSGNVAILDSVGAIDITGASLPSGGALVIANPANSSGGEIKQSGAIVTPFLSFSNADTVNLQYSGNRIDQIQGSFSASATDKSLLLTNSSSADLSVGAFSGKTLNITQTGSGALLVNGALSFSGAATLSATNSGLSFTNTSSFIANSASLGGATVNGSPVSLSVTNTPLSLRGNSGSLSNVTVNGNTSNFVALNLVTLTTPGGSITLNGSETINGPAVTQTQATLAPVASVPTVATVASVPTVAPTVATVATVASVPTVLSVPTTVSVASIPTTSFIQSVRDILTNAAPGGVSSFLYQILPPPPNFNLIVTVPIPPAENDPRLAGGNISAQALVNLVTATPPGAFIPPGAPFVVGTGAPLAVTPTIKIDPADTGGPNGQVIAVGPPGFGPVGAGPVGAGPGGGSGDRTLVPGLLSERRGPASGQTSREPPAGQLPATMNEEPMLD